MAKVLVVQRAQRVHEVHMVNEVSLVHAAPKAHTVRLVIQGSLVQVAHAEMANVIIMVHAQPMHQVWFRPVHQQFLQSLIQRPVQILRLHCGLAIKVIEVMGDMRDKVKGAVGVMVVKTT
jgi:hypothetical protein